MKISSFIFRKQSTDWLKIVFLQLNEDTELAQAVDIVIVRAKRIYILIIRVNNCFFLIALFSKRNRTHVLRVSI